jgi:DNA-binding IclR family transcriptional regulator
VPLQGTAIGAALRDEVRPDGYVTTRQTVEPDTSAAAAPVVGAAGSVVAAFNIVGPDVPAGRRHSREHRRADPDHARALSAQLRGMKEQRWKRTER